MAPPFHEKNHAGSGLSSRTGVVFLALIYLSSVPKFPPTPGRRGNLRLHPVPKLTGLYLFPGADAACRGPAGPAETVAECGHAPETGQILPGPHGLEHRFRRGRGAPLSLGVQLGGIGPALFFQEKQIQSDLQPEMGGALLHPAIDHRVNRVVQHVVQDIAGSKAAGCGASRLNGIGQVRQRLLPPPLVETIRDFLGPKGENQRVRTIEAQVEHRQILGAEFSQVWRQLPQHLEAEVSMGVVIGQPYHLHSPLAYADVPSESTGKYEQFLNSCPQIKYPPLGESTCPVKKSPAGEARNQMAWATSSGVPRRSRGVSSARAALVSWES